MSLVSSIVNSISLLAALPQTATNGLSLLGTLNAPLVANFLTNNPLPQGFPWGTRTAAVTNPYEQSPTTGVIRPYTFTIKRGFIAPDGVNKSVLLINGQFPGPTIEANWGDTIQVQVNNQITGPEEGTALHWHGILQRATPWFDGVPSVQQCPIPPGKSLQYTFKADLYGTSWYHSHYSAQYAGGLFGPMIIHGPVNVPYDLDIGPVFLSDWHHDEYFEIVQALMQPVGKSITPKSDNNLINGKMSFDCTQTTKPCTPNAGISKFRFTSGKTHRLRLINGAAEATMRFTIDNHSMTVIANDFVPIQPYETNVVTLGVGQRTDVIVKAHLPAGSSVFMRSTISANCSLANQTDAFAAIFYDGADTTKTPPNNPTPLDDSSCGNDALSKTVPFFPFPATSKPATTINMTITRHDNGTHNLWWMNESAFRANYNSPILQLANAGNTSYPDDPEWNVYDTGTNNSVRIIIDNKTGAAHPMHLHGHNFNVLAEGLGTWDGQIAHIQNTHRRDVQIVQAQGYLVIQYNTDNPGVWPLHCHIAWHVSAGLYVNMMEQTELIKKRVIPETLRQTCRDWALYTGQNVVAQIDSGL